MAHSPLDHEELDGVTHDESVSGTMRVQRTRLSGATEIEAALFRALTGTNQAFLAVGSSQIVLFCSSGAEQLLGELAENVVGQTLDAALPEARREMLSIAIAPALNESGEALASLLSLSLSPRREMDEKVGHDLNNALATIETYCSFLLKEPLSPRQVDDLQIARAAVQRGASLLGQWSTANPASIYPTSSASPLQDEPVEGASTGPTVLVVEDETALREGLRRMLVAEGYRVLEAADGVEAGDIAARHLEPIHLLVTDLAMPRSDGLAAFERVRASRPGIPAVFVSGRADIGLRRALPEAAELVLKPFAPNELTDAVARVIAASPADAGRLLSTSPVVLVVDDDDELRSAFVRVIEECEFSALPAKSGLHALKILAERHVDVVISDQFMVGMDGVRLLELVRQRFPHCVRVLFTAHASSDIVLDAVNRGGVHKVLVKSMHAVAIRDEIERAVLESDRFRRPTRD